MGGGGKGRETHGSQVRREEDLAVGLLVCVAEAVELGGFDEVLAEDEGFGLEAGVRGRGAEGLGELRVVCVWCRKRVSLCPTLVSDKEDHGRTAEELRVHGLVAEEPCLPGC